MSLFQFISVKEYRLSSFARVLGHLLMKVSE